MRDPLAICARVGLLSVALALAACSADETSGPTGPGSPAQWDAGWDDGAAGHQRGDELAASAGGGARPAWRGGVARQGITD